MTPLATPPPAFAGPGGLIRVENGRVFWSPNLEVILSVATTGGTPDTVALDLASGSDFVVDAASVYYPATTTGEIDKIPLGGGTPVPLALADQLSYDILAQDGSSIYWISQVHVSRVPKGGGQTTYLDDGAIVADPFFPASIVVDGSRVYWTNPPVARIVFRGK